MTTDHGAAGFCTGCGQAAPDERTETVARVLREHAIRSPEMLGGPWRCWGCKWEGDSSSHPTHQSAAVVAALDDETARLRASADAWWTEYDRELTAHEATKAEVERLTRIVNGYDRTPAEQRAADAEAERDAARAALDRVRAAIPSRGAWLISADDLRAALDLEEPR